MVLVLYGWAPMALKWCGRGLTSQILGTDELFNYLDKYDLELDPHFDGIMGRHSQRPWQKFINQDNQHLASDEAINFVGQVRSTARSYVSACRWG